MTSPRERAQLQADLRQQQEALVRDLLPVLDALDRAEAHWQLVLQMQQSPVARPPQERGGAWGRLRRWLAGSHQPQRAQPHSAAALARSAGEGIGLIRAELLEVLQGHGLEPFESLGQPFDPQQMQALGQRASAPGIAPGVAAGRVVEEAVRGYRWRQKLLREAQVLVAGP
ncbi:MAG: nucleotide exchange factor GrpE [Cyanobium sp.]